MGKHKLYDRVIRNNFLKFISVVVWIYVCTSYNERTMKLCRLHLIMLTWRLSFVFVFWCERHCTLLYRKQRVRWDEEKIEDDWPLVSTESVFTKGKSRVIDQWLYQWWHFNPEFLLILIIWSRWTNLLTHRLLL